MSLLIVIRAWHEAGGVRLRLVYGTEHSSQSAAYRSVDDTVCAVRDLVAQWQSEGCSKGQTADSPATDDAHVTNDDQNGT